MNFYPIFHLVLFLSPKQYGSLAEPPIVDCRSLNWHVRAPIDIEQLFSLFFLLLLLNGATGYFGRCCFCFVALTEGHVVQVVAVGQTSGSVAGVCVVGVARSGTVTSVYVVAVGQTPVSVTDVCVVVLDNLVL